MRGEMRLVGRLWWTMLRRSWRENTVLPLIAAAFAAVHGWQAMTAAGTPARLTLLSAAALAVALLAPLALPPQGVLDALRFRLLPLSPARLFLLRPFFGNPLRLLLVLAALAWTLAALARTETATVADAALAISWALLGIALVEMAEEVLRATRSAVLHAAAMAALTAAVVVLAGFHRLGPGLLAGAADDGPLLLGSGRAPGWAPLAVLAAAGAAVAGGRLLAERLAARPPRGEGGRALPRLVSAAARVAGETRRAAFAKELALVTRTPTLWPLHAFGFACAAAAASSGNAPLAAAGSLFWMGFVGNLFGPDVPLRGLTRYRLLPLPRWRVLPLRHAAVSATALATTALAAALVWTFGGRPASLALAGEIAAWTAYGAATMLLLAVVGDRVSLRVARAVGLRGAAAGGGMEQAPATGQAGSSVLDALAFLAALVAAAAILAAWTLAVGLAAPDAPTLPRVTAAALGAAATQLLAYRLHLRHLARAA